MEDGTSGDTLIITIEEELGSMSTDNPMETAEIDLSFYMDF
jgi:hypothetical protein